MERPVCSFFSSKLTIFFLLSSTAFYHNYNRLKFCYNSGFSYIFCSLFITLVIKNKTLFKPPGNNIVFAAIFGCVLFGNRQRITSAPVKFIALFAVADNHLQQAQALPFVQPKSGHNRTFAFVEFGKRNRKMTRSRHDNAALFIFTDNNRFAESVLQFAVNQLPNCF